MFLELIDRYILKSTYFQKRLFFEKRKRKYFFPFQFSINVLIMSETSLLQCSFGQHINSSCGYSVYYANEVQCVPLLTCKKPIRAHLMRLKLNGNDVAFEWQLILARAGIFNSDVASSCTVCPRHRDSLEVEIRTFLT